MPSSGAARAAVEGREFESEVNDVVKVSSSTGIDAIVITVVYLNDEEILNLAKIVPELTVVKNERREGRDLSVFPEAAQLKDPFFYWEHAVSSGSCACARNPVCT